MTFQFGTRSLRRMQGVHPLLTYCATVALERSRYDMTIPWMGGVRSAEDQNALFKSGTSKADGVNDLSEHQKGLALDIEPVGYNIKKPDQKYLAAARNHFAQHMFDVFGEMKARGEVPAGVHIHWGGLWGSTGWDKPHYELKGV